MRRRELLFLGGAAIAVPRAASAQQKSMPVIGYLHFGSPTRFADETVAFLDGLRDVGFVEGGNVRIQYRWAEGHDDRLPSMAADLVDRKVDVIAAIGPACSHAVKKCDRDDPDRIHGWNRPGRRRPCHQSCPTRR